MKNFFIVLLSIIIVCGTIASCSITANNSSGDINFINSANPNNNSGESVSQETYTISYIVIDNNRTIYQWDVFKPMLKENCQYPASGKSNEDIIIDSLTVDPVDVPIGEKNIGEFVFVGWYADKSCTELLATAGNSLRIELKSDTVLYAKVEKKSNWLGPY